MTGNAATVSNGLYSTGSYSNPSWLTSVSSTIVSGLPSASVSYSANSGAVPAAGLGAGGGGGGGNAQFVTYTVAPPASPTNTAQPALAYDPTGNLPTLGWNTANQTWN